MGMDTRADETYEDLKGSLQTGNLDKVINDIIDARNHMSAQDYQHFLGKLNDKVDVILPGVTIVGTVDQGAADRNGKPDLVIKDQDSTGYLDSDEAFRLSLMGDRYRFGNDAESTFIGVKSALETGDLRSVIKDVQSAKMTKTPEEFQEYLRQLNEKVGALLPGVKITGTFDQGGRTDLAIADASGGVGFLSDFEGDRLRLNAKFTTSPEQNERAAKTFGDVAVAMITGDLSAVIADLQKAKQMYTPQQHQAYLSRLNDLSQNLLPGVTIAGTFEQSTGRVDLTIRDRDGTGFLSANEANRLRYYGSRKH